MKTVAQIIKELQQLPQDIPVFTDHTDFDRDVDAGGFYDNYINPRARTTWKRDTN